MGFTWYVFRLQREIGVKIIGWLLASFTLFSPFLFLLATVRDRSTSTSTRIYEFNNTQMAGEALVAMRQAPGTLKMKPEVE
jgi:hypothetical protein